MNRIYLDKLLEFTHLTYNNHYNQNNKQIELNDEILKIKQNMSLNETGFFPKIIFIDLCDLIPSIEYDELVLISPISFNIEENNEWFNLLNCFLLVLHDDYIKETNIVKKKMLKIADQQYKQYLKIQKTLNSEIYTKISEITDLNLIILKNDNNIFTIECYLNKSQKWLICYKFGNNYFPILNFDNKFFSNDCAFVKYLLSKTNKNNLDKNNFDKNNLDKITKTEETTDDNIQYDDTFKDTNSQIDKMLNRIGKQDIGIENIGYEEFATEEDCALYISEAVDTQVKNNIKNKKNKSTKTIFVCQEGQKDNNKSVDESIFKKTVIVDKQKITEIIASIKSTTKLEQLQNYALELGLNIISGSTKDGKPKNKTKTEIITEIKNLSKT